MQRPTKPRQSRVVHSRSDVVSSDYVHNTLALGPKFAVDRERSAPELLSMVRSVAGRASPEDSDRCISEGVDVLLRGSLLALSAARLYPLSLNTADVIEDLRTHCQISPACSKISSIAVLPVMVCGGGMAEGVNGVSDNAIGEISGEVWWLSGRDVAVRVLLSLVARLAGRSTSGTSNEAIQSGAATKAAGVGAVIRV
ncbi:hypothetical protein HPB51_020317 [Rhipicephalus microplus]|uniref:Uncharacterized protein n=1 Tax=Rhipicephalus microplus TaxID=6941 RepID=A0A9J6DCA4_RHIMP|nr:hypothetical protein HPB51_020317 [Rhipicephalus microplus]